MTAPSPNSPAPAVVEGVLASLRLHAPFAAMAPEHLQRLVLAGEIRYFAGGELILGPTAERPAECLVVRQGAVRGTGERSGMPVAFELVEGEMFPLAALLARRGVTSHYRALRDTFVLAIPVGVFDSVLEQSAPLADFCSRRLVYLLEIARRHYQAEYVASVTDVRGPATPLAEVMRTPVYSVGPDSTLGEGLDLMETHRIGSLPVVDEQQVPLGIFTRQDVIGRVVLAARPLTTPMRAVMSQPVEQLPMDATVADAAMLMTARGIRHLVVVDPKGALAGVLSERDLFGLRRQSLRALASDIGRAPDVDTLMRRAHDIRELSHGLVALGMDSGQLTRLISNLNDQLVSRLLDLVAPPHDLAGIDACWIGMGSEGRHEQTVATDQDNGIVFATTAGLSADEARKRLLPFATEVNTALADAGYPLCKGGIMAMNPRWCASIDEWRAAFFGWIDRGDPESLLAAQIFFDFRPLWGRSGLADELRVEIATRAHGNQRFCKQMSDNALRTRAPLNWFGGLDVRKAEGGEPGIDIKHEGTGPFVDAARVLALASGVTATSTVERLVEAGERRSIRPAEVRGWADAFEHLQMVRLRTQHRRAQGLIAGSDNPNLVPLSDLSPLDRRVLREAMRELRRLQQRIELDFPG